jgi:hypothetical protein
MARLLRLLPDPACAHEPRSVDYARIFGGSGRTGTTASTNCAGVAYRSSVQRSPLVHRRGSGACPDTRRSNRTCAITTSTHSVFPDSTSPPKLNPVEPPWYGPVCPVVGEGWHREVSPYPNLPPGRDIRAAPPVDGRTGQKAVVRARPPAVLTTGSRQFVEQCLCLFQVSGIEPLGEPAVNRRQQIVGFDAPALLAP